MSKILNHVISEFSKKGLAAEYYGYHDLDHELEATYFALHAAHGQNADNRFTPVEVHYLFLAALLHNYDPLKRFEKPDQDSVERFIRADNKIMSYASEAGLVITLVLALIRRAADPFDVNMPAQVKNRIEELFDDSGIPADDEGTKRRFTDLGYFLSMTKRIAGYALGDPERATDLARKHAHSLGWHPSVISERSAKYLNSLKEDKGMFERVMTGIPDKYRRRFSDNVVAFNHAWQKELALKDLKNKLNPS